MREEVVRQVLGPGGTDSQNAVGIAAATTAALGAVLSRLDLIVGTYPTDLVFSRSHRIARHTSEWLTPANGRSRLEAIDCVGAELATRPAGEAAQASVALLGALGDLLISLIGEELTFRLMGWTPSGDRAADGSVCEDRS